MPPDYADASFIFFFHAFFFSSLMLLRFSRRLLMPLSRCHDFLIRRYGMMLLMLRMIFSRYAGGAMPATPLLLRAMLMLLSVMRHAIMSAL